MHSTAVQKYFRNPGKMNKNVRSVWSLFLSDCLNLYWIIYSTQLQIIMIFYKLLVDPIFGS